MIVEVIPAVKLPRSVTAMYNYTIPQALEDKVRVGQMVEVNFRGRKIQAIIIRIGSEKKFKHKLKEFDRIIIEEPLVTQEQIRLIFWMSEYYYLSPARLAKSLVPKIPKRHKNTEITKTQKSQKHKVIVFVSAQGQNFCLGDNKKLWFNNSEGEKLKKYEKEISKDLDNNKQTLIIVPTIYDLDLLKNKLVEQGFKEEYIIGITAQQGIKEEFEKWLEVLSGRPRVIISTKIGVLYPFNNLGSIIVDQSESWDHKQSDINPRYDVRTVVLMLGDLHKCRVYFSGWAHRLEDHKNTNNILIDVQKRGVDLKIVDLGNIYKTKEFALISDRLEGAVKTALARGEKVFLFLNRKGQGTSTVCQTCGFIFKCQNCQLPLVLHDENRLKCHYCNAWQEIPPFCPVCQGPDIRSFGQGTQRVEKYLKKIFVGMKVLRLEKDVEKKQRNKETKKLRETNSRIIIGTEYAFNKINWDEVGLVGVLNADAGLVVPDFRASERTYQLLRRIVGLCHGGTRHACLAARQGVFSPKIIIQTYHPDSHIIRAIENNKPEIFYDEELRIREELNYPPFVKLIKLIYRDQSKKKAAFRADRLYRDLTKFQKKNKIEDVEILEPVRAYVEKVRGKYRYYVILKHKITENTRPDLAKRAESQKQLDDLIRLVPDDWLVDVEPESLL